EVAVILLSGRVLAVAVIHQLAILAAPMFPHVRRPLGVLARALGFGQGKPLAMIEGVAAAPTDQVAAVEQRAKARGRAVRRRQTGDRAQGKHTSQSGSRFTGGKKGSFRG